MTFTAVGRSITNDVHQYGTPNTNKTTQNYYLPNIWYTASNTLYQ